MDKFSNRIDDKLPLGFVRLTFVAGQPAIVTRDRNGVLSTELVTSHSPYKRAIARESAQRHRGVINQLAAYDQT